MVVRLVRSAEGNILGLVESFTYHLEAEGKSPDTVKSYVNAVRHLVRYLLANNLPTDVADITKGHCERWLASQRGRYEPNGIAGRYRGVKAFFNWLLAEAEVTVSPLMGIKHPKVPDDPPPIVTEEQRKRLLRACKGDGHDERRDTAIIQTFMQTGLRVAGVVSMKVADLDLKAGIVAIDTLKGGSKNVFPLNAAVRQAIDRYLRIRARHKHAGSPYLWLSRQGRLSIPGVQQMLGRRAKEAGIPRVHPHLFRHTWANHLKTLDVSDEDLMNLGNWKDAKSARRYGRAVAHARSMAKFRLLPPLE